MRDGVVGSQVDSAGLHGLLSIGEGSEARTAEAAALTLLLVAEMSGTTSIKVEVLAVVIRSIVCMVVGKDAVIVVVGCRLVKIIEAMLIRSVAGDGAPAVTTGSGIGMRVTDHERKGETITSRQLFSAGLLTIEKDELSSALTVVIAAVDQIGRQ